MVIETESDRARNYVAGVEPKSEENVLRMVDFFRAAETKELMGTVATMYLMDMSYARGDITLAMCAHFFTVCVL